MINQKWNEHLVRRQGLLERVGQHACICTGLSMLGAHAVPLLPTKLLHRLRLQVHQVADHLLFNAGFEACFYIQERLMAMTGLPA